jgi:ribosomal protein S6E (S10)
MPHKLNISEKGKSWKLEIDNEILTGKKLGDTINGREVSADLTGYELAITGASDTAGFPHKKDIEGPELKKVILTKGWGMHKKPRREGKKKVSTPNGLRLRKTIRGSQISEKTIQINFNVIKEGSKKLPEIFPEQNQPKEKPSKTPLSQESSTPESKEVIKESQTDNNQEDNSKKIAEEVKEEVKEEVAKEIKEDIPTSPETKTPQDKEEAAEKVAEEVAEEVEEVVENIAEKEKKKSN